MNCRHLLDANSSPVARDVAEPGDAGWFELDVRVEAAGDGAMDDRLLLLVQQRDELLLGSDQLRRLSRRADRESARSAVVRRGGGVFQRLICQGILRRIDEIPGGAETVTNENCAVFSADRLLLQQVSREILGSNWSSVSRLDRRRRPELTIPTCRDNPRPPSTPTCVFTTMSPGGKPCSPS